MVNETSHPCPYRKYHPAFKYLHLELRLKVLCRCLSILMLGCFATHQSLSSRSTFDDCLAARCRYAVSESLKVRSRAPSTTFARRSASSSAVPSPIPLLAPVIMTTLSFVPDIMFSFTHLLQSGKDITPWGSETLNTLAFVKSARSFKDHRKRTLSHSRLVTTGNLTSAGTLIYLS